MKLEQNLENGKPLGPDRQGMGWSYQILPYMEETAVYQVTKTVDLQNVIVPLYVCPSRREARTAWSAAFNTVMSFMDYAGAVPCTYTNPNRTARYNPLTGVPLTTASLSNLSGSFFGGTASVGSRSAGQHALRRGDCPWSVALATHRHGNRQTNRRSLPQRHRVGEARRHHRRHEQDLHDCREIRPQRQVTREASAPSTKTRTIAAGTTASTATSCAPPAFLRSTTAIRSALRIPWRRISVTDRFRSQASTTCFTSAPHTSAGSTPSMQTARSAASATTSTSWSSTRSAPATATKLSPPTPGSDTVVNSTRDLRYAILCPVSEQNA